MKHQLKVGQREGSEAGGESVSSFSLQLGQVDEEVEEDDDEVKCLRKKKGDESGHAKEEEG